MGILDDERIQKASDLRVASMAAATRAARRDEGGAGARMIANERRRQMIVEGYGADHDEGHVTELLEAGLSYTDLIIWRRRHPDCQSDFGATRWPWGLKFWKPTIDPVRQLVKAGALIAAAIDALLAEQERGSAGT